MAVISVPLRLRLASATLYLSILLIALEVIIATRSPWWRLPYRSMGYWSLAFGLICIPLSAWIVNGKRWVILIVFGLSGVWVFSSMWVAIRMRYPALGFYSILLLVFFTLVLSWLHCEMKRSFFDPQLSWYQGYPKPIPGLKCQLHLGECSVDLHVSRMDQDGVFLCLKAGAGKSLSFLVPIWQQSKLEMVFEFKERQMSCNGVPIVVLEKGLGVGIQFVGLTPDHRKEIGDFVEVLIGEGYV